MVAVYVSKGFLPGGRVWVDKRNCIEPSVFLRIKSHSLRCCFLKELPAFSPSRYNQYLRSGMTSLPGP